MKRKEKPKKISDLLKEMALTVLRNPEAIPSGEAAHAALLFSHVAWNRAAGDTFTDMECKSILRKFEKTRPSFWEELITKDWRVMVQQLMDYKKTQYPDDNRVIVVCGMRQPGVIHVEWKYGEGKAS